MLAFLLPSLWLQGYLIGAALHMSLDLIGNGNVIERIVPFYSFAHRARRGFLANNFLRPEALAAAAADEPAREPAA